MLAVPNFEGGLLKIYSVCLPPLSPPTFLLIPFCQYSRDETWIIKEIAVKRTIAKLPCLPPSSRSSFNQMDKHSLIATFPLSVLAKFSSCEKISQLRCTLYPLLFLSTSLLTFQSWTQEFLHNLTDQVHQVGNKSPVAQAKSRVQNYCMNCSNVQVLSSLPSVFYFSAKGA